MPAFLSLIFCLLPLLAVVKWSSFSMTAENQAEGKQLTTMAKLRENSFEVSILAFLSTKSQNICSWVWWLRKSNVSTLDGPTFMCSLVFFCFIFFRPRGQKRVRCKTEPRWIYVVPFSNVSIKALRHQQHRQLSPSKLWRTQHVWKLSSAPAFFKTNTSRWHCVSNLAQPCVPASPAIVLNKEGLSTEPNDCKIS